MSVLLRFAVALVGVAVAAHAFIAWEVQVGTLNAPVADWAGLALLALVGLFWWRGAVAVRLPAWRWVAAFFALAALSALLSDAPVPALREWLRKGVFSYLAFGVALATLVAHLPSVAIRRLITLMGLGLGLVALWDGVDRALLGELTEVRGLWGLAVNHKTVAVALAPQLPLILWGAREERGPWRLVGAVAVAVGLVGIGLSWSKTAWIVVVLVGLASLLRTTGWRRGAVLAAAGVPMAMGALLLGLFGGSILEDATDARQSLDRRAVELVSAHPILGAGPGASVRHEASTWPDLRVNGVEAHGVIQKVMAEEGMLGLALYLAMILALTAATGRGPTPVFDSMVLLQLTTLLSTEAFTASHWVPVGVCLGLAWSRGPPRLAAWPLGVGACAVALGVGVSMLGGMPPSGHAVRQAVARFEAERTPPGWQGVAPASCVFVASDEGVVASCVLEPVYALDAERPSSIESASTSGLYVLERTGARLRVAVSARDGVGWAP